MCILMKHFAILEPVFCWSTFLILIKSVFHGILKFQHSARIWGVFDPKFKILNIDAALCLRVDAYNSWVTAQARPTLLQLWSFTINRATFLNYTNFLRLWNLKIVGQEWWKAHLETKGKWVEVSGVQLSPSWTERTIACSFLQETSVTGLHTIFLKQKKNTAWGISSWLSTLPDRIFHNSNAEKSMNWYFRSS